MGGGDYSLDVTNFSSEYLEIIIPTVANIQVIFSTAPLQNSSVAVKDGETIKIAGYNNISLIQSDTIGVGSGGVAGVCAIIVEGKLYARIALHNSSFTVDDCFAMTLPLFARKDDDDTRMRIGIYGSSPNEWSGFQFFLPESSFVRVTGYNLPRTLTSYSGQDQNTINAEGGDYGIEFTIPEDSENVVIFDGGFWLFIR